MAKKEQDDLQKHTLFLYRGDYDKLNEIYPEVTAAKVIRHLIRAHLKKYNLPLDATALETNDADRI